MNSLERKSNEFANFYMGPRTSVNGVPTPNTFNSFRAMRRGSLDPSLAGRLPKSTSKNSMMHDPEASLFDKDDNQSSISKSTKSDPSGPGTNSTMAQKLEQSLFTFVYSLRPEKPIHGALSFAIHLLIILQTLSLGSPIDLNWGLYGSWIVSIVAICRSYGFQFMNYEAFVALAIIIFLLEFSILIVIYMTYKAQQIGSRYWDKIRSTARFMFFIIFILSIPTTYGLMQGFWNCDYSTTVSINESPTFVLVNFPTVACWSGFNGAFAIISVIFLLIQIFLVACSVAIFINITIKTKDLFLIDNPFLIMYIMASNQLYLIVSQALPPSILFINPVLYLVISVLFLALLYWMQPFIRRGANVVYGGVGFARLAIGGVSIAAAIENTSNEWELGLGLVGALVGGSILMFFIGIIATEVYTRYMQHRGRKILKECTQKKSFNSLSDYDNYFINIFVRYAMKGKESDVDLADSFTKLAMSQRLEINATSMITCALFIKFVLTTSSVTFALMLVQKAQKKGDNIFLRFIILLRVREVEKASSMGRNNFHLDHIMSSVKKKLELARELQVLFWKNVATEQNNNEKLYNIVKEIQELTEECSIIYSNLLSNYGTDVTVLRAYAAFLEDYLFDSVSASELLEEASIIEEENFKKASKKLASKRPSVVSIGPKRSIYESDLKISISRASSQEDLQVQNFESISNQEREGAQQNFFRSAVNKKEEHKFLYIFILSLGFVGISFILTVLILGMVFSQSNSTNVSLVEKSCSISSIPYLVLADVRKIQFMMRTTSNNSYLPLIKDHRERLVNAIDKLLVVKQFLKNSVFTQPMTDHYLKINSTLLVPIIQTNDSEPLLFTPKRASVAVLVSVFQSISEIYNSINFHSYNITRDGFEFLVLLYIILIQRHLTVIDKTMKLFKKIPKDEALKTIHKLETNSNKIITPKEFFITPKKIMLVMVVLSLFVTCLGAVLIVYESVTFIEDGSFVMQKIKYANVFLLTLQRTKFKILELVMKDYLELGVSRSQFHYEIKQHISDLFSSWNSFRYGDEANSFRPITGLLTEVDKEVSERKNCTENEFDCYSLDDLVLIFQKVDKINDNVFLRTFPLSTLMEQYTLIFNASLATETKTNNIIDSYVSFFTTKSTILTAVFSSVSSILLLIVVYFIYNSLNNFSNEVHQIRIMLNQLHWELLDSNSVLHAYVFNYTLSVENKRDTKKSKDNTSKEKAILEAAVEGAVICSTYGNINIFNESAQRMFGYRADEVIGTQIADLFSIETRSKIDSVVANAISSSSTKGETIPLIGIRKNKSQFPAVIDISVANLGDEKKVITCFIKDQTNEKKRDIELKEEKKKSEALLMNILPESVAHRLQSGETFIADKVEDCTCLFSDIVDFNLVSAQMSATSVVQMLNMIINGYDSLIPKYNLEKIKTIGEKYFCVGGLPTHGPPSTNHVEEVIGFAMDIFSVMHHYNIEFGRRLNVKVGIHTGGLVAGVIGTLKFAYDVWGDVINVASRMESTCQAGRIQLTKETFSRLNNKFDCEERRDVFAKGKGLMTTYLLNKQYHQDPLLEEITIDRSDIEIAVNQANHGGPKFTDLISNSSQDVHSETDSHHAPPELAIDDGHLSLPPLVSGSRRVRSSSVNSNYSTHSHHSAHSEHQNEYLRTPLLSGAQSHSSNIMSASPRLDLLNSNNNLNRYNVSPSVTNIYNNQTPSIPHHDPMETTSSHHSAHSSNSHISPGRKFQPIGHDEICEH